MKSWRSALAYLAAMMPLTGIAPAFAQDFPNRPVKIVTGEAGGSNDIASRIVAQGIGSSLGKPVIVENHGGVVSILAKLVARSAPDGHTLLVTTGSLWVNPMLEGDAGYDAVRDFKAVSMLSRTPVVLLANPALAARDVGELLALAKARPGTLNYGTGPVGATGHLSAALFNYLAGVNITLIPYKGGAPALNDLIGGRVQLMFGTGALIGSNVKSGKLRALAVGSADPSSLFPGMPTIASTGVPGYEFVTTQCLFAPSGTPQPIVNRISREVAQALEQSDVRDKFLKLDTEPVGRTPEYITEFMKADIARMSRLIKDRGISTEP